MRARQHPTPPLARALTSLNAVVLPLTHSPPSRHSFRTSRPSSAARIHSAATSGSMLVAIRHSSVARRYPIDFDGRCPVSASSSA